MVRGWEVFRALRYRDFFWFWSSYFVSNVGSWPSLMLTVGG